MLKEAFRRLYANNTENVVVLNDGLEFQESSSTSVEMQLNENKETNNKDACKIFLIPPSIINGNSTAEDKKQYFQGCIMPILVRFSTAINRAMLREDEKTTMFFAFDDTRSDQGKTLKSDLQTYKTALDSGFMQLDEVRKNEKITGFRLRFY